MEDLLSQGTLDVTSSAGRWASSLGFAACRCKLDITPLKYESSKLSRTSLGNLLGKSIDSPLHIGIPVKITKSKCVNPISKPGKWKVLVVCHHLATRAFASCRYEFLNLNGNIDENPQLSSTPKCRRMTSNNNFFNNHLGVPNK